MYLILPHFHFKLLHLKIINKFYIVSIRNFFAHIFCFMSFLIFFNTVEKCYEFGLSGCLCKYTWIVIQLICVNDVHHGSEYEMCSINCSFIRPLIRIQLHYCRARNGKFHELKHYFKIIVD